MASYFALAVLFLCRETEAAPPALPGRKPVTAAVLCAGVLLAG
jgi:hypothetical protein